MSTLPSITTKEVGSVLKLNLDRCLESSNLYKEYFGLEILEVSLEILKLFSSKLF